MPSLHEDAQRVLTRWHPPDAGQAELRARYLRHMQEHPDGTWRECHPDHLTASALVVSRDLDHTLLTLHRKIRLWLQTGGHCERTDATLAGAALREAREESGLSSLTIDPVPLQLSFHEVPCGPRRPAHHLDVQYAVLAGDGGRAVASEESADLRWFGVDELPEDTDDVVRTLVRRALHRLAAGRP